MLFKQFINTTVAIKSIGRFAPQTPKIIITNKVLHLSVALLAANLISDHALRHFRGAIRKTILVTTAGFLKKMLIERKQFYDYSSNCGLILLTGCRTVSNNGSNSCLAPAQNILAVQVWFGFTWAPFSRFRFGSGSLK